MTVVEIKSIEEFDKFIKSDNLSVVHFYAPWVEQCSQMKEVLDQMAKLDEYKNVQFANIEAEAVPHASFKWEVNAVPTTLLFEKEKITDRINGVNPRDLREKVKEYLSKGNETLENNSEEQEQEALDNRLKKLINQAPCMLFMKGNKSSIRCGFSKTMIALLEKHNAEYETFDILLDHKVREGLKKFSNWPTYPQLYVKGELIGGVDIIKEMSESGELDSILPKKTVEKPEPLEDRLKKLINKAPCTLFMKGNRETPRCGFSKSMIALLESHKADYETFDILEDDEVREGLKDYSEWPTYPQLYINGELIGGLDVVTDMSESGELDSMLPKKDT